MSAIGEKLKFSVIFIHGLNVHKVPWTVSFPRSSSHQIKIYCSSERQPNIQSNDNARSHRSLCYKLTTTRRQNYLTVIRSRKRKQLHLILISLYTLHAFCSHFAVQLESLIMKSSQFVWVYAHFTNFFFLSLSLNPYLLNFSHSMAQNYSDYWALFFLDSHSPILFECLLFSFTAA